jgi:DNA-binding NtrC family response regulator
MNPSADTLEGSYSNINASSVLGVESPALLIAWAADLDRMGEVAIFDGDAGAFILGRGAEESTSGKRVRFYRQRPEVIEMTPPLTSPRLSREQLRICRKGGALHVERIGKCAVEVRGERVDQAVLEPGDTLLVKGQLLLFCMRRPRLLPPLAHASFASVPSFGGPDAHGLVGESPLLWRLRDQLAWLGQADAHTLVLGESGSGKELCARAVHALSARASGPFVARSAATIPESIIDAELFGNVKGYPNPGMPERPGLIGAANGGTLFLDEIGELPQRLQANLLRVLDEGGEYHRLGGPTAMRSRFRLIGATNRDPGALKHDLAARLVLRLDVPGLEARREDIPLIVRHLLRRAAAKSPEATRRFLVSTAGSPPELRIKASLIEHLLQHRYTTHLRELDALLWHAMATSKGEAITWPADDPRSAQSHPEGSLNAREAWTSEDVSADAEAARRPAVREPSEAEIRERLAEHAGNVARSAEALGLSSRYVLYRLMRKYGIEGG